MDMSTTSSMSSMAVMTTSGSMSMSTGMPMAGTDGMNSSSMDVMGMDSMAMVFFTSSTTPLYSWSWTPSNQGQYAGTCIFLIVLAAIFKGLLFLRISTWSVTEVKRWEGDTAQARRSRWRANTAVKIATLDTILAGVGYLLMLAVMTMNVGYFMSVLAGIFMGSMMFGQHTSTAMGSSCC